ncbi:unnamed protein product [Rhizoctonia solani]|uniref:Mitochondrial metal transporter 2 n=1 Tax=Rhizoctonia solani TaxID=456999 RepID=A0A8H2X2G8_9AGAM|nr:unnamed protein product [Rhizoctonia solani]
MVRYGCRIRENKWTRVSTVGARLETPVLDGNCFREFKNTGRVALSLDFPRQYERREVTRLRHIPDLLPRINANASPGTTALCPAAKFEQYTTSHVVATSTTLPTAEREIALSTLSARTLRYTLPRRPFINSANHVRAASRVGHVNNPYVSPRFRFTGALYSPPSRPSYHPRNPPSLWFGIMESTLTQRRGHTNKAEEHDDHSHSHGIFHSHSHSHGGGEADEIIKALTGTGDAGSRITLIGLASNVVLSATKGIAGVYLNSAALVADAAHSLSDLMGDFVTLACWKISRKPPTDAYPYGYGKFETLGTTVVSLILVGGAAAIGLHSYTMLLDALSPTLGTMQPGPMHDFLQFLVGTKQSVGEVLSHTHGHAHIDESAALDPNAAWFALASVVVKEWNYRSTKAVADEMKSPVLLANAYHHRSDAYSSLVTLLAIVGTWAVPTLPLDPLGGMLVSLLILQQGISLCYSAFGDFTDAGVSPSTRKELALLVDPLVEPRSLIAVRNVRAVKSGSLMFVDLTADVPARMTVLDAHEVERRVRDAIMEGKSEVKEVRVHLHAVEEGQSTNGNGNGNGNGNLPC